MQNVFAFRESLFSDLVLNWFDQYGRKTLPWQKPISPYRVWISEIMLQQTQVKTVIPYFNRFIKQFPTIFALAQAKEDEVLTLWSGLGYYARARNLYKTALIIQQDFDGHFPMDLQMLQKLPGIGRSTAGAILAIAGNQSVPILDGNVKRILTRFHAVSAWPGEANVLKKLWDIAEQYTPIIRVSDYTQAIMDLGAIVCTKKPQCILCPLKDGCMAFHSGEPARYPIKKTKQPLPIKSTTMLILQDADQILLKKRASVGVWGGLWCFPETNLPEKKIRSLLSEEFYCDLISMNGWPSFRHTFTHFHLDIKPLVIKVKRNENLISEDQNYLWHGLNDSEVAMPTPVRKIISLLNKGI